MGSRSHIRQSLSRPGHAHDDRTLAISGIHSRNNRLLKRSKRLLGPAEKGWYFRRAWASGARGNRCDGGVGFGAAHRKATNAEGGC